MFALRQQDAGTRKRYFTYRRKLFMECKKGDVVKIPSIVQTERSFCDCTSKIINYGTRFAFFPTSLRNGKVNWKGHEQLLCSIINKQFLDQRKSFNLDLFVQHKYEIDFFPISGRIIVNFHLRLYTRSLNPVLKRLAACFIVKTLYIQTPSVWNCEPNFTASDFNDTAFPWSFVPVSLFINP